MELRELIFELCGVPGPSGFETAVAERIRSLLSPFTDEVRSDVMGNLIAVRRCGKQDAPRLMLDAHMDEIGFIVTGYSGGHLRFSSIGGVDPRMLPARELMVLTEPPIFGVIDTLPPHALSKEDMDKSFEADKLYIDVGLSEEAAKRTVPLGTPCVFAGGAAMLGDSRISGKALDDRACVAILIKVMENLKDRQLNNDIYVLISTQEEVGLRGAVTGAYGANPDRAVVVDVTHAATPDSKKGETMEMLKGAAIGVGPNMNRGITQELFAVAERCGIPCQTEVISGDSGTNGWVVQTSREGVATAIVSLPIKYMHTPVETMDIADAESIVSLLTEFIAQTGGANDA